LWKSYKRWKCSWFLRKFARDGGGRTLQACEEYMKKYCRWTEKAFQERGSRWIHLVWRSSGKVPGEAGEAGLRPFWPMESEHCPEGNGFRAGISCQFPKDVRIHFLELP
jgi:hypothetical protein